MALCKLRRLISRASRAESLSLSRARARPFPAPLTGTRSRNCSRLVASVVDANSEFDDKERTSILRYDLACLPVQCFLLAKVAQVGIVRLITSECFANARNKVATRPEQYTSAGVQPPEYLNTLYVLSRTCLEQLSFRVKLSVSKKTSVGFSKRKRAVYSLVNISTVCLIEIL